MNVLLQWENITTQISTPFLVGDFFLVVVEEEEDDAVAEESVQG